MNRTGWVGRNELKVHVQAGQRRASTKTSALFDDLLGNRAGCCGRNRDVDKAGASDVNLRDTLGLGQFGCNLFGKGAWVLTEATGCLHCYVGGPIAVLTVFWPFDDNLGR